jgi:hypothetical protein
VVKVFTEASTIRKESAMKAFYIVSAAIVAALTITPTFAAPPEAAPPMSMPMADHSAQMHAMMAKADSVKTPAERNKLMADNMAMMKVHMADMSAMMNQKPMAMPASGPMKMPMDAAHMEKMGKHMAMVNQMLESLMLQQQLMMKSGK